MCASPSASPSTSAWSPKRSTRRPKGCSPTAARRTSRCSRRGGVMPSPVPCQHSRMSGPCPAYGKQSGHRGRNTGSGKLRPHLADTRDQGYVVARHELDPDVLGSGAPVRAEDVRVIAAISIAALAGRDVRAGHGGRGLFGPRLVRPRRRTGRG
ncbi:IclR family transcriptional regulator C-terminal domain-containing protein [Streptomyces sp. NPDC051636]|uniref:IclR family transcriptional regulator domain-containing protein n=1 Tax=Streptomyces sp. NPDC051636 TaxID=3365663 RepID=UPI0037AFEE89